MTARMTVAVADGRTIGVTLFGETAATLTRFDARTGKRFPGSLQVERSGRLTPNPYQHLPRDLALLTRDGRRLVVGGVDDVTVRDAATLDSRAFPTGTNATFGADGRLLATGGDDGAVRLWDVSSGQAIGRLEGVPARYVIPLLIPGGMRLLTGDEAGQAHVWDLSPAALARHACRVAGRRLTRAEWQEYLPSRDYRPAC